MTPEMNNSLAQRVQRIPSPMDAYTPAGIYYGGQVLVKNNDVPEAKPQSMSLVYCRLYRGAEIALGLKVCERVYQGVASGQVTLLEESKNFNGEGFVYIAWGEYILASPELADKLEVVKAQHIDIEALVKKESANDQ